MTRYRFLAQALFLLIFLTPQIKESRYNFENKKKQLKTESRHTIPHIFHIIWIGTRPFPIKSLENLRTFKKYHPKAHFIFWSDQVLDPILDFLECRVLDPDTFMLKDAYLKSKNMGQKSDIARLEILNLYGGIYADHDAIATKPLIKLIDHYDFVIGAESGAARIGIGLILSKPQHPIIQASLKHLKALFQTNQNLIASEFDKRSVINSTYSTIGKCTKELVSTHDLIVPSIYFYPKNSLSIFSKHLYQSSWMPDYCDVKCDEANNLIKSGYTYLKAVFILLLLLSLFTLNKQTALAALFLTTPLFASIEKNIHIPFFNRHTIQKSDQRYFANLQKLHPQHKIYLYSNNHLNQVERLNYRFISSDEPFIAMLEIILKEGGYCIDPAIELKKPLDTILQNKDLWCWQGDLNEMPQHTKNVIYPLLFASKRGNETLNAALSAIKKSNPNTYSHPTYQFYHKIVLAFHTTLHNANTATIQEKLNLRKPAFFLMQSQDILNRSNLRWVKKCQNFTFLILIQCFILAAFLVYKNSVKRYT